MDQTVENFEHGLDSILMDSVDTPEVDAFFEQPSAISSSVSSGFPHLVSTVSDTSRWQLAPSIKPHKLWCQARVLLLPVPQSGKMSAAKLIQFFF